MEDFSQRLESLLKDPELMGQIMAMASSLNGGTPPQPPPAQEPPVEGMPDMAMLQKISGLASQTAIEPEQRTLLQALTPYLSPERLHRLERAMRAAKTARLATEILGSGGWNFLTGR